MAATDIQYGDYSPVLNTVDFSFLKYVVDKKTSQYEQGLKSVSSSYNALKKDVSDPMNAQKRDQYLKNAQSELQKIAGTDLSLQQNVNAANSIFQPMATDKAFLIDSYYTAENKKQLAEMDQWRNSEDMETRKKFNPLIYNWLQSDLDSIKNGKGDVNNYKVKGRKAFAAVNAQDILNKAVTDGNFTVSQDIDGGKYVYNEEGGKLFKQNYKTFADEVLRANPVYMEQNQILGEATNENIIKEGKAKGLTDQQALSQYADFNYTNIKNNRNTYITGVKDNLDKQKKDLIAEANGVDDTTPEGQAQLAQLAQRRETYNSDMTSYTNLKTEYDSQFGADDKTIEEKKAAYINNFLTNPKGFFSQNYMDTDINTFSNIKSQSVKSTIKANTAYFNTLSSVNAAQKTNAGIKNAIENTEIRADAQDLKERHEDWIENGKPIAGKTFNASGAGGTENVTTINADGTLTTTKQSKKPQITYVGASAVDITKTMATLNAYDAKINENLASSINNLAGAVNGGALGILNTMGVKRENIQTVRAYFTKQQEQAVKDPSSPYRANNAEAAALKDVYSSMFAFAKLNKNEEALGKLRAEYGKDTRDIDFHGILDLAISQTKFKDEKDWKYVNQWKEHKVDNENVRSLSASLAAGKKAVVAYLTTPEHLKEFEGVIIKGKDGKPDILDEKTLSARLPKKGWFENKSWAKDTEVVLSDADIKNISKGYLDGSLQVLRKHEHLSGGDNPGDMFDDDPGVYVKYNGREIYLPHRFDTFPLNTDDFKKKTDKINSQVLLPEMDPSFKQQLMASPIWNINGAMKQTILASLVPVTQFSSNIKESDGASGFVQADTDLQNAARAAMADPKNIAENGVYVHSMSGSNNGGVSVAVTFAEGTEKEKKSGDCKYCGKTLYFPIDPVKGTPEVLQAFNTVNEQTEYNLIKNTGKTYDLYNYEKMGIKVQMLPHTAGSDTGDVLITVQKQDPITHNYIPGQYETIEQHYDLGSSTFTELKNEIYNQMVNPYIVTRLNFEKQQSSSAGSGKVAASKDQILKGL